MAGDTSGQLQLATNGSTTAVTIDTSQNVGIGTASPSSKLTVASSNVTVNAGYGIAFTGDQDRIMTPEDNVSGALIKWASAGICRFLAAATERMRIDSSGNVGIGQSSPRNRLTVNGAISGLNASATAASNTTLFITGTTAAYMIYATWNNGGGYAVIIAQGNISNTAVVIASSNAAGGNNAFDVTNSFASNSGNGIAIFPNAGGLNLQIKQNYSGTANVFINIFGM
jgi:hypothetical protein